VQRVLPGTRTSHRRFFNTHPQLSIVEVTRFTTVDHVDREALIRTVPDEIVGVVTTSFVPTRSDGPSSKVSAGSNRVPPLTVRDDPASPW
jgi:hypothetical protein